MAIAAPVSKVVDLSNTGTYRGEQPGQLQSVVLPAAPVVLPIILPRFSPTEQYLVAVTRDQSGNGVIAEGFASASSSDGQERVSLDLDLRSAKAGAYFLPTTHEQDQAAYCSPLRIKEPARPQAEGASFDERIGLNAPFQPPPERSFDAVRMMENS